MGETSTFFDMTLLKCITKKGERVCGSFLREWKETSDGFNDRHGRWTNLPPMIIFRGKIDQTIRNLIIPPGFIVRIHEKAWMGCNSIKIWVEEIWLKHTQSECKRPRFQSSMSSFDAFVPHLTD